MRLFEKCLVVGLVAVALCGRAAAREVYTLNDNWKFFFRTENSSDAARNVTLPHTWNAGSHGCIHATADYLRNLYIPSSWRDKRLFLRFYGVQNVADIFINGEHAGEHRGGFTAFTVEITGKVRFDYNNSLHVMVSNYPENDIFPLSTEINLCGGICREAELIVTDNVAVTPDYYGTDGVLVNQFSASQEAVEGSVTVHLLPAEAQQCSVELALVAPDGYTVVKKSVRAKLDGKPVTIPFTVPHPALWSPSTPNLYEVEVVAAADTVRVATGFRSIEVSGSERFLLNGRRLPVRGVTLWHDREGAGCAFSESDLKADLDLITDMGANAVRSATAPHPQYLYSLCDRRGVMVWLDFPLTQAPFPSDEAYIPTPRLKDNGRRQVREIIAQNYNHPSVVMWGVFSLLSERNNDILDYLREINDMAKRLDPSRPTVACSNRDGDINFITDLMVWQQAFGWEQGEISDLTLWQKVLSKNWNSMCHGVIYGPHSASGMHEAASAAKIRGRSNLPFAARQKRFHEGYAEQLVDNEIFWGVWLGEMFDFASERYTSGLHDGGVVTADHAHCKDIYYLYRSLWNTKSPTLHINTGRPLDPAVREHSLEFYSSYSEPVLTVNGERVEVTQRGPTLYVSEKVPMSGRCEVEIEAGGVSAKSVFTIGNSLKQR